MARRVGDDERAPLGREIAIGDVDRDPLFAFGLEPVDQERVVDTLRDIVAEMRKATTSERQGRLIDSDEASSMEKKKREGYF